MAASHRLSVASLRVPAYRPYLEAGVVAAGAAVVYLIVAPSTGDHATQEFRTTLFEERGFAIWSNLWYAGHHLPGYSLVFPPLAAALGPRLVGALATVAAALLFAAIASHRWGDASRLGVLWFATAATISIFTGRLTFVLGVAVGLGAVLAAQRGRRIPSLILAALCTLSSPVAGVFLALAGLAWAIAGRERRGLELAAVAFGTGLLMALAFPEGGSQPFTFGSFAPTFALTLLALALLPGDERMLRAGLALYALGLVAAVVIDNPAGGEVVNFDNPMGSNAARLAALFAGPLLACALWGRADARGAGLALAVLAPAILYWQWSPVVRELLEAKNDPSDERAYYDPVRDFVRAQDGGPIRVEVVPAVDHWEAAYLPPAVQLARGWERQLDVKLNPIFYEDNRLIPFEYREWLEENGISVVALSNGPLDFAAEQEAELIRSGLTYLELAYEDSDWRIYRVKDPTPLSFGAGRLVEIDTEGFAVDADSAGTTMVRLHWTPYWAVTAGEACLAKSPQGFTRVKMDTPGRIRVRARYTPWRARGDGPFCGGEPAAGPG